MIVLAHCFDNEFKCKYNLFMTILMHYLRLSYVQVYMLIWLCVLINTFMDILYVLNIYQCLTHIYVYIHARIYMKLNTHTHTHTYTNTHTYLHTHTQAYAHIYKCAYTYFYK